MKRIDFSKLPKNIGIMVVVIAATCLIGYVPIHFLAWLTGLNLSILLLTLIILFLAIGVFSLCVKHHLSKYWLFMALGWYILGGLLFSFRYGPSDSSYVGDKIKFDERCYGLANKWGFTVLSSLEDGFCAFFAINNKELHQEQVIGMNYPHGERCEGYKDKDSYEYHLDKGTVVLRIFDDDGEVCKYDTLDVYENWEDNVDYTKDDSKTSLYEYIESNYGKLKYDYEGNKFEYLKRICLRSSVRTQKKNEGYEDLGPIDCYHDNFKVLDNEERGVSYTKGVHLYVKSYNGKERYYIAYEYSHDYLPLTKGSYERKGERFNAKARFCGDLYYYVNVPFWEYTSGSSTSSVGSGETVVIEQSGPRQEWVPCPVCGNGGRVGLCQHCNGTGQDLYYTRGYRDCPSCGGLKRCTTCGGNGGHYETRY